MKELRFVEVERRNPTREELDSSEILVGDVGMEFNIARNNFDHHQDRNLPCAFAMVFKADVIRFIDIKKIIVHGGFVAHLDEIYMVAFLDAVLNRKQPNAAYMQQGDLALKISVWDTMGPNEYKKRYPNDFPGIDSFINFLQTKWAKNPNDKKVREFFMNDFLNTDGNLSVSLSKNISYSQSYQELFKEYENWLDKKQEEIKTRIETLENTQIVKVVSEKINCVFLKNKLPLSEIDGLPDSFMVVEFLENYKGINPDITISIQRDRDSKELIYSAFRTTTGEKNRIDLEKIEIGSETIFKHKNGFLHNFKTTTNPAHFIYLVLEQMEGKNE